MILDGVKNILRAEPSLATGATACKKYESLAASLHYVLVLTVISKPAILYDY